MPPASPVSSSESLLSQISFALAPVWVRVPFCPGVPFPLAGVKTLTPGTLVLRAGVPKISECSSGAGRAGEESKSSSVVGCVLDFPLSAAAGVSLEFL